MGRAQSTMGASLKYLKRKTPHLEATACGRMSGAAYYATITSKPVHPRPTLKSMDSIHSHYRYHSSDSQVYCGNKEIIVEKLSPNSSQEDIADALRPHFQRQSPVLLHGLNSESNCRAMSSWESLDYLQSKVGDDTPCLVEVGGSYSNPNVQRPEITFGDYIMYMKMFRDKYDKCDTVNTQHSMDENNAYEISMPKQEELVYLAQNDMFPPLWDDFQLPDLCQNQSLEVGKGSLYSTMFWFGPRGCVSPLHFDPLDNLLIQMVGRKKVILYPRSHDLDNFNSENENKNEHEHEHEQKVTIPWHYAGHEGQQYNTSPINLNDTDRATLEEKYPLFAQAPVATECILEPGSMLYIPSKWWHHVTSLDTAISVNTWWR